MMLPTFNQYMYLQHSSTVKRFTCMSMIAYMYMCGYTEYIHISTMPELTKLKNSNTAYQT